MASHLFSVHYWDWFSH